MSKAPRDPSVIRQLAQLLRLAGAHPTVWAMTTVAASIVLALLDMLGVAALIPLTQLISGASADSGALARDRRHRRNDIPRRSDPCGRRRGRRAVRRQERVGAPVPVVAVRPDFEGVCPRGHRADASLRSRAVRAPPLASTQRGLPQHHCRNSAGNLRPHGGDQHVHGRADARGDRHRPRDRVAGSHAAHRSAVRWLRFRPAARAASPAIAPG